MSKDSSLLPSDESFPPHLQDLAPLTITDGIFARLEHSQRGAVQEDHSHRQALEPAEIEITHRDLCIHPLDCPLSSFPAPMTPSTLSLSRLSE